METILQQMRAFPLFSELSEPELAQIAHGLQPVSVRAGECLYVQGQQADSAFFLISGRVEVLTWLPGGAEVAIAELGPGSMLGETSLVEAGVRTASVRATSDTAGFTINRQYFQASIAQFNVAAFKILRQIMRIMCARLRGTHERLVTLQELDAARAGIPAPGLAPCADGVPRGVCSFDWPRFLPLLRFLQHFEAEERVALVETMDVLDLERGCVLFDQGEAGRACYLVVRGAVELSVTRAGRKFPLMVLGPGEMCGAVALLDQRPHAITATVRERATLLELGRERFQALLNQDSWLALKFQIAICENQVAALARANRRLTALVSQASIQGRKTITSVLGVQPAFGEAPGEGELVS